MSETTNFTSEVPAASLWSAEHVRRTGLAAIGAVLDSRADGEPHMPELLAELEPAVAANLDRHEATREFWVPRDFFPIDSDGRIINRAEDLPDEQPLLSPTAQAAMTLNLLTEDNLPAYHRTIATLFGRDGAWGTWVNKWTAEENRHAYVMRAFLDLTGSVDTTSLETDRLRHMENGYDDGGKDPLHSLAYVAFQELATRISHRNTGEACHDKIAGDMLARIAKDENLHMVFYRNLVASAFEIAPNQTMRAVADEVISFKMPGNDAPGYRSKSLLVAKADIYNLAVHHKQVVEPILRYWKVFARTDLGPEGEQARGELAAHLAKLQKQADRFEDQRGSGVLDKLIARALAAEAEEAAV